MKIEKSYRIDGELVVEEFKNGDISVYSMKVSLDLMCLYFINNKSEKILFKQIIQAGCIQNCGFIADMSFQEVK